MIETAIDWIAHLAPATLSAYAAGLAAMAAAIVALLQFFIGMRQSGAALRSAEAAMLSARNAGTRAIASSRQEWINNVIETLSEYHALQIAAGPASIITPDTKRMRALRTKLEILLNPDEQDTIDLLAVADEIFETQRRGGEPSDDDLIRVARKLLKREWVRIKTALGDVGPTA